MISGIIFAGPWRMRGIWYNALKVSVSLPIFGRITCAHERSETTFRQNRGGHLFGSWALLWTHQENLLRSPRPVAGGEG